MSILTDFLKLFKWDTSNTDDLANQFDINKSLNENWDKIDEKAKEMDEKIENALQSISNNSIIKSVENIESARIYAGEKSIQNLKISGKTIQNSAPSIESPCQVDIVGDNINFFDGELESGRWSPSTGNAIASAQHIRSKNRFNAVSNQSYIASCEDETITFTICAYDADGNFLAGLTNGAQTPDGTKYINISANTSNLELKIKLEKGTQKTGYTNYNCGGIDLKITGKNILKLDDRIVSGYTLTNNGITYMVNDDYSISIKGTCGSNVSSMVLLGENLNNYATKRWYQEKDIFINFSVQGLSLNCRNVSGSYKSLLSAKGEEIGVIYLQVDPGVEIDAKIYPYVSYEANGNFELYKEKNITIELPENEFLGKIGDYEDYIDSKGIIHKNISKYIMTGEEAIVNITGTNLFAFNVNKSMASGGGFCNHYVYNSANQSFDVSMADGEFAIQTIDTNSVSTIYFKDTRFSSAEEIKEYYKSLYEAGEPIEIYYPIAEYYTNELAESEKEKLNIELFIKENNIYSSAPLSFDYVSDINYEITKLNDKISEIENLLGSQATSAMLLENVASDNESGVS